MKIFIDDKATESIKDILSKKTKPYGIRIYINSYGLDNPNLSLSLYELKENDKLINVNNIDFYLDNGVEDFDADIEVSCDERFGSGFTVSYKGI